MVILKGLKSLLSKFTQDIGHDIYRIICKFIGYVIVFLVIGLCASRCAKAMTITDNLRTINETQLTMLKDIGQRSKYKYYVIASEYTNSGYNNYTNYFICLTNEKIDVSTPNFLNTSCEKIYRYTNSSNNYSMTEIVDKQFNLSNVIYYTNYNSSDTYKDIVLTISIILFATFLIYVFIVSIFRGFL